jgi:hypothetical protein
MRFLAQGDFNVPFQWFYYWTKHFYMWSFQSGAPNPDGIIRLPGRLLNFVAFGLWGDLGAGYFYIFFSFLVAFVSFYIFGQTILKMRSKSVLILASILFAVNPIFLGNVAKVGLVLAASLLPLCFVVVQRVFTTGKLRYILVLVILLNLSFIHPYTFAINTGASFVYFAYLSWRNKQFVVQNVWRILGLAVVGILLNAYFIFPMLTMGTVSKDAISNSVTPISADYTALVDVSNTGSIFTGFALAKNVFKDFEFYNNSYRSIFYVSIFVFYALLFGTYIWLEKRYSHRDRSLFIGFLGIFLVLTALATVMIFKLDVLIKILIHMPGGWAFRSPLKWQLYIPLALASMLAIVASRIPQSRRKWFMVAFLCLIVSMNGYLAMDIGKKILAPRTLSNFSSLQNRDMNLKTMLFINSNDCMDYMRNSPRIVTEMNQVLVSKDLQVKHVSEQDIDGINLGSYDYVLGCYENSNTTGTLTHQYDFKQVDSFANKAFQLYRNQHDVQHVFIPSQVYSLNSSSQIGGAYNFANTDLKTDFTYLKDQKYKTPTTSMQDIFSNLTTKNMTPGMITVKVSGNEVEQILYSRSSSPIFYRITGSSITLSSEGGNGMALFSESNPIKLPAAKKYTVSYQDTDFDFKNLVDNPSLESGLWQKSVSDCYNYDINPEIGMSLDSHDAADGSKSLELHATRHVACTGPDSVSVKPGEHYLVSFDYQSLGGKYAGYMVRFDDKNKSSITERMQTFNGGWHSYSKDITIPEGASHMRVMLLAYPDGVDGTITSTARYDNIYVSEVPPIQSIFYMTSIPLNFIPPAVNYSVIDPTKKVISVSSASTPFYLATNDSYNKQWTLDLLQANRKGPFDKSTSLSSRYHVTLNGTMNAWYIDPVALCKTNKDACVKHEDGKYSFTVTMQYKGQKTFYEGAIVSAVTSSVCISYIVMLKYKPTILVRLKLARNKK